jgi:mono/diheme cytochrome c family protein
MATKHDADLFDTVTKGRPGTGMPAWGSILNERDRWNVVAYIRTFAAPP